jgi:hypothetical protein
MGYLKIRAKSIRRAGKVGARRDKGGEGWRRMGRRVANPDGRVARATHGNAERGMVEGNGQARCLSYIG